MIPSIRSRKVQIVAQSVVITALVGGTGAFVALNKPVNVTVDGESQQVRSFGSTVDDVLASQDLTLQERDQVQPARSTPLTRDMNIVVNRAKDVSLTIDGKPSEDWTTASTVGQALADLGVDAKGAEVSAGLDDRLTDGARIDVVTPKTVSVLADGKTTPVDASAQRVSDVLSAAGIELGENDITSAPLSAPVFDGQVLTVMRVEDKEVTETEAVKKKVTVKKDSSLPRGQKKVQQAGRDGTREVVYQVRLINGAEVAKDEKSAKTVKEPVEEIVLEGTKKASSGRDDSGSGSGGSGSGDSGGSGDSDGSDESTGGGSDSGGSMSRQEIIDMLGGPGTRWYKIVKCESNFDPKAVNQSNRAHFGLFQFKLKTWQGVGGKGNPVDASPQEQFKRAKILKQKYGWGQWSCA